MKSLMKKPDCYKTPEEIQNEQFARYNTQSAILEFQRAIESRPDCDYSALRAALKTAHNEIVTFQSLMIAYGEAKGK